MVNVLLSFQRAGPVILNKSLTCHLLLNQGDMPPTAAALDREEGWQGVGRPAGGGLQDSKGKPGAKRDSEHNYFWPSTLPPQHHPNVITTLKPHSNIVQHTEHLGTEIIEEKHEHKPLSLYVWTKRTRQNFPVLRMTSELNACVHAPIAQMAVAVGMERRTIRRLSAVPAHLNW